MNAKQNDKQLDSDIKWYEEIRKVTTGLGGDYNTGYLLNYDYMKNHSKRWCWFKTSSANRIHWIV